MKLTDTGAALFTAAEMAEIRDLLLIRRAMPLLMERAVECDFEDWEAEVAS